MSAHLRQISSKVSYKNQKLLPYERAADLLDYNPTTGKLTWKSRTTSERSYQVNSWLAGREAGTFHKNSGYLMVNIDHISYQAHRIAFLLHTGEWPAMEVDHISHDKTDNRWVNIREVTESVNLKNKTRYSNNKSGFAGVCWDKSKKKWIAYISVNKKVLKLGVFDIKEDAAAARKIAEEEHGYHKNHGAEK